MAVILRLVCIPALILIGAIQPAISEETNCNKFAWSIEHERTLFAASDKQRLMAGAELTAIPASAIVLGLQSAAQAIFVLPPERRPKSENWFGGALRMPAPEKSGSYQVTISEEAWIDIVQDGRYARSIGSTGRSDCSGLRKSVRFDLNATPFVVQFSGVAAQTIVVAINHSD